jgi:hypothetical protein
MAIYYQYLNLLIFIFFLSAIIDTEDIYLNFNKENISSDPRAYVVLAADFDSLASTANYGILAPLTSFIWHRVFNVTPVVILSTREGGRLTSVTEVSFAKFIRQAGGRIHCISRKTSKSDEIGAYLESELVGESLITALQVSRLASIALHYMKEKDVIFTSDADIWPMSNLFWLRLLSKSLSPENDDFLVYSGPFFHSQLNKKDCNFLALTSVAAKTRVWLEILSKWLHSLQYAPSPRIEFCVYPNATEGVPILPWYTEKEQDKYAINDNFFLHLNSDISLSFSNLLNTFLEQGQRAYGAIWKSEVLLKFSGDAYKKNHIWNYDQVLAAEMVLASRPSVVVNEDFRRLDKFGQKGTDFQFISAVLGKSVEDFTDAHLDSVEEKNWWRLEEIWLLIFRDKSSHLQSAAIEFFQDVRSFSDMINTNLVTNTIYEDISSIDSAGFCDQV